MPLILLYHLIAIWKIPKYRFSYCISCGAAVLRNGVGVDVQGQAGAGVAEAGLDGPG
ncbi:MAG: hypothetical protein LBI64_07010 [Coriobacteriales bacterium]|nr:hypothetical protein [Coriobacteriales bacterium]